MPDTPVAERLVELADHARALGRAGQADRFLLLAWAAYEGADLPLWRCVPKGLRGGAAATLTSGM